MNLLYCAVGIETVQCAIYSIDPHFTIYYMIDYTHIAHLRYPRHMAYAYQIKDSSNIHCVKYTDAVVEWEYFTDWEVCKDYMVVEPESFRWGFKED